ncbi:hypothetical protein HY480_02860 [Candidatus Uhrbacteria bacterium]|nr:hypothetical protein [Candidatus Uhrbacteria bacterium]
MEQDRYEDEDEGWDAWHEDDEDGENRADLGLCPHGQRDDDGCGTDGCRGGAKGWDPPTPPDDEGDE